MDEERSRAASPRLGVVLHPFSGYCRSLVQTLSISFWALGEQASPNTTGTSSGALISGASFRAAYMKVPEPTMALA